MHKSKRNNFRRTGVASLLAMLFLILFSILALGFYSVVTTSVLNWGSVNVCALADAGSRADNDPTHTTAKGRYARSTADPTNRPQLRLFANGLIRSAGRPDPRRAA